MTPQDKISKANEAKRILESPVYKEASEHFLTQIRALRLQIKPRDTEGAFRLVLMEQTVERTKRMFEEFLFDAELAKRSLDEQENPTLAGRLMRKFRTVI